MTTPAISLLLKTASDLKDTHGRETQIAYLRAVMNDPLRYVLQGTFHPNVIWLVNSNDFLWKPAEVSMDYETKFYREYKKLYVFCRGGGDNLPKEKRDRMFSQFLEGLHPNDAYMVVGMVNKNLERYPGITYDLVREAFPNMLPFLDLSSPTPQPIVEVSKDNLDSMDQNQLALYFKQKFGKSVPEVVIEKLPNTQKGCKWFHDPETDKEDMISLEEGVKRGWVLGRSKTFKAKNAANKLAKLQKV